MKGNYRINSKHGFTYVSFGLHDILIEWPKDMSTASLLKVNALDQFLNNNAIEGVIETVPAYHSLLVSFDSKLTSFNEIVRLIEVEKELPNYEIPSSEATIIPVDYSMSEHSDLATVSKLLGMPMDEIVKLHCAPEYEVHFIGFLPGFCYLGGLDERLSLPRKAIPKIRVPAGSVALAAGQTGIYPIESPGGWYIIGQTKYRFFNHKNDPPSPFYSGARIRFQNILEND